MLILDINSKLINNNEIVSLCSTQYKPIRISFTAVVLATAIASASAVLEIGIINGSQSQITPSSPTSPSPTNKTVSPELKSKMCDPNNPKLRFVNTTESNICGIPKTIIYTYIR